MGFRAFRRIRVLALSLTMVTATTTLFTIAWAAGPASAASTTACPASKTLSGDKAASNVTAGYSSNGSTTTYTFSSTQEHSVSLGVPGLIKYCVYTTPQPQSVTVDPALTGANGAKWTTARRSANFAFVRPGGDKTNIPLDGTQNLPMGTADWGTGNTAPATQTILLHINDTAECARIYGSGSPATCYVLPRPGPICDAGSGDTAAAYNVMPFGVINCSKPSWGFEARSTNELGQDVTLASGTPRTLDSLSVLFTSYACSVSGKWYTGDCVTTPGATFTHTVTARIYDPANLFMPIAYDTETFTIPYRPSGDAANCPAADGYPIGSRWLNPATGQCQYSISTKLTFSNWTYTGGSSTALPGQVIWTVAYNTTHAGYQPLGENTTCAQTNGNPGCPYDSLNVGTMTFPNSPYAGAPTSPDEAFLSTGTQTVIHSDTTAYGTGWTEYTPLAEITTK